MKNIKYLLLSCAVLFTASSILVSCIEEADSIDGVGTSRVRVEADDNFSLAAFPETPATQTVLVIRRDAVSSGDLNSSVTVDFTLSPEFLASYNLEHSTSYLMLADAAFSFEDFDGSQFEFGPGEFAKDLVVNLDPATLDLSKKYALPIVLTNPTNGYELGVGKDSVLLWITVKNKFHGLYQSTGYFMHPTAPRAINREKELLTSGVSSATTEFADLGSTMNLLVNPDNTVTFIPPVPQNAYMLYDDASYNNTYDPATQTFSLKYEYIGGNGPRTITEKIARK